MFAGEDGPYRTAGGATLQAAGRQVWGPPFPERRQSNLGGVDTSILHLAFISIFITLWAVITHYVTILMPILSCFTRFT